MRRTSSGSTNKQGMGTIAESSVWISAHIDITYSSLG